MRFSKEQQELLKIIGIYCKRGDQQPKPIFFETVISKITPPDCFVNLSLLKGGFAIVINDEKYQDPRENDKISGLILSYLFLVDQLVKENLIIVYDLNEKIKKDEVYLDDKNGKHYNAFSQTVEYRSEFFYSTTFGELIQKYMSKVLRPSYTLIEIINNNFKTTEEINSEKNLNLALNGLNNSKIAIYISVLALVFSGCMELMNYNISKNSLKLNKESLIYSKISSTEEKQDKLNFKIDSISNEIKQINIKLNAKKTE